MILYINWFKSKDDLRNKEFLECLSRNKKVFSQIVNLSDKEVEGTYLLFKKARPTYNDFFAVMQGNSVLANLDIYFDSTLKVPESDNDCYALTRYEWVDGKHVIHPNPHGSQDCWIFKESPRHIVGADFTQATAGCDNKIAHLLNKSGYKVTNPCKKIKCYHIHQSEERTYIKDGKVIHRLPPPYLILPPV